MPHKRLIRKVYKNIDINSIEIVIIENGRTSALLREGKIK
jgi:hypothetical protein